MLVTLLKNVDEKNVGNTPKNVEKILATLLKNVDEKKYWQHILKKLTRKNVGNTSEKC
jgi:archaellum biogenesis protein FlaJ (TadC family)